MKIIVIRENIYLCDMEPEICDQIRLSIMAARKCGFVPMEGLANKIKIAVLWSRETGTILKMGRDGVTYLTAVMVHIAREEMRSYNSRIIHEILEALTCAMEMAIDSPTLET